MKITTAAEMREIDRVSSQRFQVPSLTLMENAGTQVANFVLQHYPAARRIAIVCGKGNNGGDGFVAARKLHHAGREVSVLLLGDPAEVKGDAAVMFSKLPIAAAAIHEPGELNSEKTRPLREAEVILDAILGTGFQPPVKGLMASAIELMNSLPAPLVAVDIPSGASADAFAPGVPHPSPGLARVGEGVPQPSPVSARVGCCRADAIVTFTAPRPAHLFAALTTGPTLVGPIGSPEEAIASALHLDATSARDIASFVALRAVESNKGSYGHVLTIGGSLGKSGAAAMAGMGALRSGAGLSTVAIPRSVLPLVAGFAAELMTEPLPETGAGSIALAARDSGRLDAIVQGKTVLALGPGISRHPDTVQFIRAIVGQYPLPLVIDADGLNALEGATELLDGRVRPLLLTPHPGEMARLTGLSTKLIQQDRIGVARSFARDHHCIVVLKGHRTLIAEPDGHVWVNTTGNPGMATGGTGDVLTGLVAGLLAQHPQEPARAAAAAVFLHGLAGDVARDTVGEHSLVATDLLRALPEAFHRARQWAKDPEQLIFP
jgi:NAD(P)H-hydrate epimerase